MTYDRLSNGRRIVVITSALLVNGAAEARHTHWILWDAAHRHVQAADSSTAGVHNSRLKGPLTTADLHLNSPRRRDLWVFLLEPAVNHSAASACFAVTAQVVHTHTHTHTQRESLGNKCQFCILSTAVALLAQVMTIFNTSFHFGDARAVSIKLLNASDNFGNLCNMYRR